MNENNKKIKSQVYPERSPKIFVAMSGGVDSSVAALLLKQKEYDLVGCFIKGWYPSGLACGWKEDRRDAMRVCAKLGIPFITINAEKEYKRDVVDYMIKEYKAGRTPNPDIMCNRDIKFGVFLKKALKMGADYIATGHYVKLGKRKDNVSSARLIRPAAHSPVLADSPNKNWDHAESTAEASENVVFSLATASDLNKDQSYFLWTLKQEQLKYCLFPLGDLLKPEVRKLAEKFKLPTAKKEESQGVCFVGEFNMEDFLKRYIKSKKGKVTTVDGKVAGEHDGVMFYTIGQRHGFGFGGGAGPYYIVAKDIKKNILIVADKKEEEKFGEKKVEIINVNWISGSAPDLNKIYKARVRYRQPLQSCKISKINKKTKKATIFFKEPQRAVTPGQSLVLYKPNGEMLGGGIISLLF